MGDFNHGHVEMSTVYAHGIIMGEFNHGHIQWTSLQSTGREDQEFFLI